MSHHVRRDFFMLIFRRNICQLSLDAAENRFIDSLNLKMIAEVYEVFLFLVFVFFLLPKRTRKAGTQPKLKY
jgi:hypothetical protein